MNYILFLKAFLSKYKGIKDNQLLYQYLREELQYLILYILCAKTSYPVYFMGGTKLRLSYGINRFSEYIDLALDKPNHNFPAEQFFNDIKNGFSEKITGFRLNGSLNAKRNVIKIMLAFRQVLFDIGLSPLPSQTIKIKIEVDTNPPGFAAYEKKNYRSMAGDYMINTHDLPTGFAGKIGTILFREYQKGRDYYDLQWYLQYKPVISMNLKYLNSNSLQQKKRVFNDGKEAIAAVAKKVEELDIPLMRRDLERFIVMDEVSFLEWLNNYVPQTLALLQSYKKFL